MKKFVGGVAACAVAAAIGFGVYLWWQIRSEQRRVLVVTDAAGVTTEVHQPLVTRYVSGPCSSFQSTCRYEEVDGLQIEDSPGANPANILWGQIASVEFTPPPEGEGAHAAPEAVIMLRDGSTRKGSVNSYELHGDVEFGAYTVSLYDVKKIIVAEGGAPPPPLEDGYSNVRVQSLEANGTTQTWDGMSETSYPGTTASSATGFYPENDERYGIRLWQGDGSFDVNWGRIKELDVNPGKLAGGQAVLRVSCVFTGGQSADFTIDPGLDPTLRQQIPGTQNYNELKLEDVRRIDVAPSQ